MAAFITYRLLVGQNSSLDGVGGRWTVPHELSPCAVFPSPCFTAFTACTLPPQLAQLIDTTDGLPQNLTEYPNIHTRYYLLHRCQPLFFAFFLFATQVFSIFYSGFVLILFGPNFEALPTLFTNLCKEIVCNIKLTQQEVSRRADRQPGDQLERQRFKSRGNCSILAGFGFFQLDVCLNFLVSNSR